MGRNENKQLFKFDEIKSKIDALCRLELRQSGFSYMSQ